MDEGLNIKAYLREFTLLNPTVSLRGPFVEIGLNIREKSVSFI